MPVNRRGVVTYRPHFLTYQPTSFEHKAKMFRQCCALFALFFIATCSWAQASITYDIKGVEQDKLRNNIRVHLSNLDVEKALLTDPYWQDEVAATVAKAVQPFGYYNSDTNVSVGEGDNSEIDTSLFAEIDLVHNLLHGRHENVTHRSRPVQEEHDAV